MKNQSVSFRDIAVEVAHMEAMRETIRLKAFEELEHQAETLALLVMTVFGDRARAAQWMCTKHRGLEGRSVYEALADGEFEAVWDFLLGDERVKR
jgi:uncharacterized protein (DUF2384 family)